MLYRYPNAVFFVTSDDITWCQDNIMPPKLSEIFTEDTLQKTTVGLLKNKTLQDKVPIIFSRLPDSWADFSVLTLCNHSIITVGTFGWWSAWLANGDVVYYKDYPLPGTKLDYELKKEDFFPEHWVALSGNAVLSLDMFLFTVYTVVGLSFCLLFYLF
uniref:L-Fucosyltransferase n=1 Tax=Arion vulgaris TaxID=1028688 RepID=A0A0B6YVN7_9EUPU